MWIYKCSCEKKHQTTAIRSNTGPGSVWILAKCRLLWVQISQCCCSFLFLNIWIITKLSKIHLKENNISSNIGITIEVCIFNVDLRRLGLTDGFQKNKKSKKTPVYILWTIHICFFSLLIKALNNHSFEFTINRNVE